MATDAVTSVEGRFTLWAIPILIGCSLLILSGCALPSSPTAERFRFFPPESTSPRIQFLTSLMGEDRDSDHNVWSLLVGTSNPEVNRNYGLWLEPGQLFVADPGRKGYFVKDLVRGDGRFIGGSYPGALRNPAYIYVDGRQRRYLCDPQGGAVHVFDQENQPCAVWRGKQGGNFKPVDLVVYEGRVYVSNLSEGNISVLDEESGSVLATFGQKYLKWPTSLALGPDHHLYVTDSLQFAVLVFTLDGKLIRKIGQAGDRPGQFARPKAVAVDREGRAYILDGAFENIQVFNAGGQLLGFFGGPGNRDGDINMPADIAIDYLNVDHFRKYSAPGFDIEYLIAVSNQTGAQRISIYGFGQLAESPSVHRPISRTPKASEISSHMITP